MNARNLVAASLLIVVAVVSCSTERRDTALDTVDAPVSTTNASPLALAASPAARARIAELRGRFPALGAGIATSFVSGATSLQAVLPVQARRASARGASVELPTLASGFVRVEDEASRLSVRFSLRGARKAEAADADGFVLFAGALEGADLLHRVLADGTEDYVVFEHAPAKEELTYDVDVSKVAGLRLVESTLELLDAHGTPRLRIAPPFIVDARGQRHAARMSIAGCAYDPSGAAPWGRPVTAPGAASCEVHVAWRGTTYPALLDPSWMATGAMTAARYSHTATLLPSGAVLLAGGDAANVPSAELYDPATRTFGVTGSMSVTRYGHVAALLSSGKVLVAGTSSADLYDPSKGTFTPTDASVPLSNGSTASVLASGKVLVAGGAPSLGFAALYDPVAETFTSAGGLGGRESHTASTLASGQVLLAGGLGGGGHSRFTLASADLYDPATGNITPAGAMGTAREFHTGSTLSTGKVLVAGGYLDAAVTPTSAVELYDPATNTFGSAAPMSKARARHTASVLRSGKVLLAGGAASASAELYDPATGTFTVLPPMVSVRFGHTATELPSGGVLITGGGGPQIGSAPLSSAETLNLAQSGTGCAAGNDCVSGICDDGICCVSACGTCATCTAGSGACAPVVGRADPDTCTGAKTCDAAGACKLANGQACPGGGATCASGSCADGFCCDTACDGGCDYCNLAGKRGTCSVAAAGDPGAGPSCSPYLCDGKSAACPASCTQDTACVPATTCDPATKKCVSASTCDGNHTTTGPTGTTDCSPYKCDNSGICKPACASIDDCVAPSACDPAGHCIAPTATTPSQSGGGCSATPSQRTRPAGLVLLAAAACAWALVRRSSRSKKNGVRDASKRRAQSETDSR